MSRGKSKQPSAELPPIGNPADPQSLYNRMLAYLEYLRERNYSDRTVSNRETYLRYFFSWCDERGLGRPNQITKPILESYQRHLYHYRKANGKPLSIMSQNSRISSITLYFRWLAKRNELLYNPASDLDLPRAEKRLPKDILTSSEVEIILNQPDISTAVGIRDRAILETLYSTGMRRGELLNLRWSTLDYERGTAFIEQGKGKKDRMVPIGERALKWLYLYQFEARPDLALTVSPDDEDVLFLTNHGERFTPNAMSGLVAKYIKTADIGKTGSCHLFRHTCATLMLENGADVRYIQAMLGHAKLETTAIYTQVSIKQLKDVHTLTHPAGKLPERLDDAE